MERPSGSLESRRRQLAAEPGVEGVTRSAWAAIQEHVLVDYIRSENWPANWGEFVAAARPVLRALHLEDARPKSAPMTGPTRRHVARGRTEALSIAMAVDAGRREDVKGWRKRAFPKTELPIDHKEVYRWIERRVVPLLMLDPATQKPPPFERLLFLDWPHRPLVADVESGSLLGQLTRLGRELSVTYRCTESEAIKFVLCDSIPLIPPITIEVDARKHPSLTRIVMTIDPVSTPSEVEAAYRLRRSESRKTLGPRYREPREKYREKWLNLAVAVVQMEGAPGRLLMEAWNRAFPNTPKRRWTYNNVSAFDRDAQRARRHLLRLGAKG